MQVVGVVFIKAITNQSVRIDFIVYGSRPKEKGLRPWLLEMNRETRLFVQAQLRAQ